MQPPFFSALHALAIDDGGGRAGFSFALLPTRHIKRVMDAIQRAVVAPQVEIVVLRGGISFGIARHWHPVLKIYMIRSSLRAPRHGVCCCRAWRAGLMVRHAPMADIAEEFAKYGIKPDAAVAPPAASAPASAPAANCARAETHWKSADEIWSPAVYYDQ